MARVVETMTGKERSDHLLAVIASERFLKKQGLGNEVPFFICPFNPEDAVDMDRQRGQLVKQLANRGVTVLQIDLYDLSISILKDRGSWDRIIAMEEEMPKDELLETLQGPLDPAAHLIPAIARMLKSQEFDVLFLSGVGEVFPFIRSHNVLNNLQSTAKDKPTVMFFPGTYTHSLATGASLELFCRLRDDKYYRAFNIFHYEV
jgi:hypothetical protein